MISNKYADFFENLSSDIKDKIKTYELLKNHIFFKIGGPADLFFEPQNIDELKNILKAAITSKINYYIIGNGTNLLASDKGFRGLIIKIGEKMSSINIDEDIVTAEAGALLTMVSKKSAICGLSGLEFACGIPGYIGGAIAMNAGAYNGEMKDVLVNVECMDQNGNLVTLTNEELNLGYRYCGAVSDGLIILRATMKLKYDDKYVIHDTMKTLNAKRIASQPLNFPSAGSTFKRPQNGFAAKLIEDAGLKGFTHNGAMVSDKHSGFVVNYNNATCNDVLELMQIIIDTVYKKFDIKLEPEVKIIGEF